MSPNFYRIYIRFGGDNCVRLSVLGDGVPAKDGLHLFEWMRDQDNITRLRSGIQFIHEVNLNELGQFLEFKLCEDRKFRIEQMDKYPGGGEMLDVFKQQHLRLSVLGTGVDKLEAISNATEITTITPQSPRKRSDEPEWLYLIDLDNETLEVYEFRDYRPPKHIPSARLTTKSLFRKSPENPQGYYIKVKLSELQTMWRSEWLSLHEVHAETLKQLWKRNASVLQTIPHADNISFPVLYGGDSYGRHANRTDLPRSRRLTRTNLTEAMAALNRRKPSKVPIFERKSKRPQHGLNARPNGLHVRMLAYQAMARSVRQRRRASGVIV
ncbi:hypothetical protein O1611_g256 [Lasiodiplodia mahajangana]|uniref:Uncharacterized protein n=1 Tax=Lasiodiplodia mahajangana TaxID=1108764 RepID=A0ACC2K124_9PEZI|nr:hypothetical protein O1611_g256 [Lasiodiplodia mahajangana]